MTYILVGFASGGHRVCQKIGRLDQGTDGLLFPTFDASSPPSLALAGRFPTRFFQTISEHHLRMIGSPTIRNIKGSGLFFFKRDLTPLSRSFVAATARSSRET